MVHCSENDITMTNQRGYEIEALETHRQRLIRRATETADEFERVVAMAERLLGTISTPSDSEDEDDSSRPRQRARVDVV